MKKFKRAIVSVLMTTCMVVTPTAPVSASNVTDSGYTIFMLIRLRVPLLQWIQERNKIVPKYMYI